MAESNEAKAKAEAEAKAKAEAEAKAKAEAEAKAKAEAEGEAEKEEIFIPKMYKDDDALFVAVNGKRMLIKKGEHVKIPKAFAEVIRTSQIAQHHADAYIIANAK